MDNIKFVFCWLKIVYFRVKNSFFFLMGQHSRCIITNVILVLSQIQLKVIDKVELSTLTLIYLSKLWIIRFVAPI